MALSTASDADRPAWRWRLGRDYAARGLYAEADGVLRTLAADSPKRAATREFRLLRAEVLTELGEGDAALALLDTPILDGLPATCLQRMAAAAQASKPAEVRANAACAEPALALVGDARRTRYLMAAARAEIALGDLPAADAYFSRIAVASPAQAGEVHFWRGVIAKQRGQHGLASEQFARAAVGAHPAAALRAETALIELRVTDGKLQPAAALARLAALQHVWRGGSAERDLLLAMASMADRSGDLRGAFGYRGVAAQYFFQDETGSARLRRQLADRFARVFADSGAALEPLDAFALFWDFRDLAPQGPAADAMVRRLADRLASLGLSAQAANLLEHQVYNRLEGSARGLVAIRLAALLNDAGRPAQALAVLAATQGDSLPAGARADRRHVEAAALIGAGRPGEAKALLAESGGAQVRMLRGEAAWAARDWNAVIATTESELPSPARASTGHGLALLLRVTVAAAMEGDDALLRRLRQRYAGALATSDAGQAFEILTGDPASVPSGQLRSALALAAARASASAAPSGGKTA